MNALFIGGTGNISTSVSNLSVAKGIDLCLLNRGTGRETIPGARSIAADIRDPSAAARALEGMRFDTVVDWIAFTPDQIETDIALLRGRTRQFIFISSASVYQKPPNHPLVTESTPLANPYWEYSRNKIACEERLMKAYRDEGFPVTIVRPSLTYRNVFPVAIGGWGCCTLVDRIRRGKEIIVHGDGSSLWTVTHADDFAKGFVGLMGHARAIGHSYHITSDEILTWNQIYATIAEAAGCEPRIVHIPSDFIARVAPDLGPGLLGDKTWSVIFDNSKIKTFVPGFTATIPFTEGIRRVLAWFDEKPERRTINGSVNQSMDRIVAAYDRPLSGS
jgi:nucleoside-diphosphate-sugar epimerase